MIAEIAIILVVTQANYLVYGNTCLADIHIGWKNTPPYIYHTVNYNITGILLHSIQKAFGKCCSKKPNLILKQTSKNIYTQQTTENFDMFMPLVITEKEKRFTDFFVYVVDSPGSVLINFQQNKSRNVISYALKQTLPVLFFIALLICEIGVVYWMMLINPQKKDVERSFHNVLVEVIDGVWWAFLKFTTIGSNVTPTRLVDKTLSRLLLVTRIVLTIFFIGLMANSIVETFTNKKLDIFGKKIAVIDGSLEQKYVVNNGGYAIGFIDIDHFFNYLDRRSDIDGGLFDLYSVSYYGDKLRNYHHKYLIDEENKSYGVFLYPSIFAYKSCLTKFFLENVDETQIAFKNQLEAIKNFKFYNPETMSKKVLDDLITTKMTVSLSVIVFIVFACGCLRKYIILMKNKRNYVGAAYDSINNFVMLHTVKTDHQYVLKENMKKMQNDLQVLQAYFEHVTESLQSKLHITDNLFRANIPIPYERLNDIDEE
ncbi:uncharacterized protein LOC105846571 isoform X2 [Hydra vulgaris]|uniref:Uncharacterized protein LOC105846571 isoform X2 n=1 Tax=Hydra vulgaris TaxID=6087 RepID=A0ABM4CXL8_HYDVU